MQTLWYTSKHTHWNGECQSNPSKIPEASNPDHTLATMHIAEEIKKPTTHTFPTSTDSAKCQNYDIE